MRKFTAELRDITLGPLWMGMTVYYDNGEVELMVDERGRRWTLACLTEHDREIVEQKLMLNLQADEVQKDQFEIDYLSDWGALRECGV